MYMKRTIDFLRQAHWWLCLVCAVALFACSDEENTLDGTEPTEDDNPVKVVDDDTSTALDLFEEAMASGETLKQVTSSGSTTYVTFGNDETVTLSPEYYVVDATRRGRPLMGKSSAGTWTVDGIDMHVPVAQPGTGEQRIVCVCYDANSLTVYLNDDSRLLFHTEGDEGIYAFYIEPLYNDRFGEVVEAVIQGNTIEAVLPEGMESGALVATFCFRGQSVEVDGVAQQSRVTVNSFDEPVAYALTKSDGTVETYQVRVHSVRLPQIYITTAGGAEILDKENYVDCTVRIEDPSKLYTDGEVVEAAAGIRGRGNSTWDMPKKPYKFKLEEKERLLGMSKDKEWALLANYADKSMMRNLVAFKISEIVGMRWTPKSVSVEFYLNGKYQGLYALTEHVKVSDERLDIDLADGTVEGDYLMELDFHYDEGPRFMTDLKQLPMMFKDPDELTDEQFNFVKDFFNKAESVLYSDEFTDPENGYRKYIDINSFVDYFIVQELSKNCDGNMRGSCYMALMNNSILEQPLVWDFDIAFGNAKHIVTEQGASSDGPLGWYIKTCSPWFDQLFKDPVFVEALKQKWNAVKPQLDMLPAYVQNLYGRLRYAAARNYAPVDEGGAGWNVHEVMWPNYVDRGVYEDEVDFLIDFIESRLDWLDTNINSL